MTAFLTVEVLRAHSAPDSLRHAPARRDAVRPVLFARWLVAPDGRLTCRWQIDDPAPDHPAP